MQKVRAYDESQVTITREVLDHIQRKHPQMFSMVGLSREQLVSSLVQALGNPDEVYVDTSGSRYCVKRIDALYLNVIVVGETVKTAYLMGNRTYRRMRKTRWLRRLY